MEKIESRSKEENTMETKEQLEKKTPEAVVEEVVEEKVEESPKVESPVEEAPKEEVKPKEEPKAEEKLEVSPAKEVSMAPIEESKEELQKEAEKTKEELAVVREARDELVSMYAKNRDLQVEKESLSKNVDSLTNENKGLKEQLQKYVEAEERLKAKEKQDRIERLSAKFKLLGQDKSVEQLSSKDAETLSEFENIVDAALEKTGETKELPEVTVPSQAEKQVEEKPSKEEVRPEVKKEVAKSAPLSENRFFANICKKLTVEQTAPVSNGRAVLL